MVLGWKRAALIGVSALALGNCVDTARDARAAAPSAQVANADLAQCFEEQAKLVPFSGVVVMDRSGATFSRAAGTADGEEQIPVTRATQFRLASVQKVLTKIAIGRLVDQGKLTFDAPISRFLKGLPAELGAVTVEQLLHHRSGVSGFLGVGPELGSRLAQATTATDLLPLIVAEPLEFRPGEREAYSNGGYWVLGAVIEAITGKSYGQYLDESIYRPLGMSASGLVSGDATAVRKTRMAPPGSPPFPEPRPVIFSPELRGTPSGDGVSTADDMMKLGKALLSGSFVQAPTLARLFPSRPGEPQRFGQSGGSLGTNTDFAVYPQSGLVSIVLSNYDPPAGDGMGRVLRQAALGMGCKPLRAE
ncbi:MAG TPA: serine hydrolase domain-containing protein, partial [Devosia sp.]